MAPSMKINLAIFTYDISHQHHRLVLLSSRTATGQVEQVVGQRVAHILCKVELQMSAKCADRSFPKTKAALEKACKMIGEDYRHVEKDLVSFVVVS